MISFLNDSEPIATLAAIRSAVRLPTGPGEGRDRDRALRVLCSSDHGRVSILLACSIRRGSSRCWRITVFSS